ncbi:MAG: (d)CMP kinase [Rubrobacter sp.]|nr:(d)CMP kinase [Rubrobacter sp.]
MLIAIDGPAGSGKSSVARAVARRLGLVNLNTGATYRAVALVALREGVDLKDGPTLAVVGGRVELTANGVFYDGELLPEDALRTPEVSAAASKVSAQAGLRKILTGRQRMAARTAENLGGAVVEGRDIGTVVLPEAELKIFLSASPEERARRRALQTGREGELERIRKAIQTRDRRDSEREASPLKPAADAVVLDTTSLSLEGVVGRVVELVSQVQQAASRITPESI